MKGVIIILGMAAMCIACPKWSQATVISLDDVVNKVSQRNLRVLEEAARVYQAKEAIDVARGNLFPRLNLWSAVEVLIDPTSVVGAIEDIAPFLVPGNWFRAEETKMLAMAEREGYRALWANEVMTAKILYLRILQDQELEASLSRHITSLGKLYDWVADLERFGNMKPGSSVPIKISRLGWEEDRRKLQLLIRDEIDSFAFSVGEKEEFPVEILPVPPQTPDELSGISPNDMVFRATDSAPELRQYEHIVGSLKYIKKEIGWSFLGVSSASRGVAGGIFDHLSIPNGLGFDTAPAMRIASTEERIIRLQQEGVRQTIQKRLASVVRGVSSDKLARETVEKMADLSQKHMKQLYDRLEAGDVVDAIELTDAWKNVVAAETALITLKWRVAISAESIYRLLLQGDYNRIPAVLEDFIR